MIDAAKSMINSEDSEPSTPNPLNPSNPSNTMSNSNSNSQPPSSNPNILIEKRDELYKEATTLLKKLADKGYPDAQYFLADCYANGIGTVRGKQDFDRAFPLFALAAKHGHPDACYRAGTCCENGWGCRRENAKAIQYYKWVVFSVLHDQIAFSSFFLLFTHNQIHLTASLVKWMSKYLRRNQESRRRFTSRSNVSSRYIRIKRYIRFNKIT